MRNLNVYKTKRTFEKTPEPKPVPSKNSITDLPIFCVQKHAATRLHYDFRLEHQGVLLSWAVPKGPSLDPSQKRLAIQVEDHPYDYHNFEGIIPKGNYGAGTVMLWDEGTYTIPGCTTKKQIEKKIKQDLAKGHLEFVLQGKKLKGTFVLLQMKGAENDKQWLFIKKKEDSDPTIQEDHEKFWDQSVITSRDMEEITQNRPAVSNIKKKSIKKAKEIVLPGFLRPMLARLVTDSFDDQDWIFEIKWDGYRALAYCDQTVQLFSRNANSFNAIFSDLVKDLRKIKSQVILDGEVVILDSKGKSNFQLMQNYQKTQQGTLCYFVFDLLFLDGKNLRNRPLLERKEQLKTLIENSGCRLVKYSDHVEGKGIRFFEEAKKKELEGIVAKQKQSPYLSTRSSYWLKIKTHQRQEVVIGGYTSPRGGRKNFGALLIGVYNDQKELVYSGHVGGGFDSHSLVEVFDRMQPYIQEKCPFKTKPKPHMPIVWIKPVLVCEVRFAEWTKEGMLRQPIFQGLRMDKKATSVKREIAVESHPVETKNKSKTTKSSISKTDKTKKTTKKNIKSSKETGEGELSNPTKLFWPKEKYTKEDLLHYYQEVADFLLPYLKDRPLTMWRFPNGITGKGFVQKDSKSLHLPPEVETASITHEEGKVDYLMIQNRETLGYVVNLAAIELHTFNCTYQSPNNPDYFVLDLDPEDVPFDMIIQTAQTIHQFLDNQGLANYCTTSGGRGLHIYFPLNKKYTFEQGLQFGHILANQIHEEMPQITSLERSPSKRQKKIYLDIFQNHATKSVIAPYSVRARPGAPVAMPLQWDELQSGLLPTDFTIKNTLQRLKKKGDLLSPILKKGIDLRKWLKKQG